MRSRSDGGLPPGSRWAAIPTLAMERAWARAVRCRTVSVDSGRRPNLRRSWFSNWRIRSPASAAITLSGNTRVGVTAVTGVTPRLVPRLTRATTSVPLGPLAITSFRERALDKALHDLAAKLDPERFAQAFGASLSQLDSLIAEKTVTISKLLEIAPVGTEDPTATLYNSTMYVMAGLLIMALAANLMVKPVDSKLHM